nr:translation initiation factor IF-2-like [Peromyscus maniculatus bairdii]
MRATRGSGKRPGPWRFPGTHLPHTIPSFTRSRASLHVPSDLPLTPRLHGGQGGPETLPRRPGPQLRARPSAATARYRPKLSARPHWPRPPLPSQPAASPREPGRPPGAAERLGSVSGANWTRGPHSYLDWGGVKTVQPPRPRRQARTTLGERRPAGPRGGRVSEDAGKWRRTGRAHPALIPGGPRPPARSPARRPRARPFKPASSPAPRTGCSALKGAMAPPRKSASRDRI